MITGASVLQRETVRDLPLFAQTAAADTAAATAEDSIQERDEAMEQGAAREERADVLFFARATQFVLHFLLHHGPASGETITDACKRAGIVPLNDKAFGSVYMRLSRERLIEKAGFCARAKGHGTSGGNIWKLREAGSLRNAGISEGGTA